MDPQIVLIIEDNPITRKMARVSLEGGGYAVVEATDGKSAMAALKADHPHLILQDLFLPDMDGTTLLKRLRETPEGAHLPIIAFSGSLTGLLDARKAKLGFTDYLVKPVGPVKLVQLVQTHLPPPPLWGEEPKEEGVGRGRLVFVVSSNIIQRKRMQTCLTEIGFKVRCVSDGVEAMEEAKQTPPCAVLSDALLPRMDGFTLCRALRSHATLSHVPVILISSLYLDEQDLRMAGEVGANAYLQKTLTFEEIIQALIDSLAGKTATPAMDPAQVSPPQGLEVATHRVIRQLEQQVVINAALAETATVQAAQLSILVGASEVLVKTLDIGKVLREVLGGCLDAGGVSMGAAYLMDATRSLLLKAQVGYPDAKQEPLTIFFGYLDLLYRVMEEDQVVLIPSSQVPSDIAEGLLQRAKARSMLLMPLVLNHERLGVFMMVSGDRPIETHQVAFANVVRGQVTQAVALSRTLSQIEYQSTHDPLTDLPNRMLLYDRLKQVILSGPREHKSIALLVMDLDGFKEVNDTLGHRHGDLLLQALAVRIQAALRTSDTSARLGGDEFAVLLPKTNIEGASLVARKILQSMASPLVLEGVPVSIGVSIGISVYPDHGENPDLLVQRADLAMYAAKRQKNTFAVYSDEYERRARKKVTSTEELGYAIEHGQLFLLYQPVIQCKTGQISGLEALIRWQHPREGVVLPDQFIPLAERTGIISALTTWSCNTALRQYQAWGAGMSQIHLSINLSAWKLHDLNFPDQIAEMVRTLGLDCASVKFEITEASLMSDLSRTTEVLARLKGAGVSICIDDFGVGYSSLGAFKKLPVEAIKIDRTFVANMMTDRDNARIVRSGIELGHNLGFSVGVDGVEDEETWKALVALGCDTAQGYYLGCPMSSEELARWSTESPWGLGRPLVV